VDIDPLNRAATLARVKHGTVYDLSSRVGEICISANVGWVVTTELEIQWYDPSSCSLAQPDTTLCRTNERNQLDLRDLDDLVKNLPGAKVDHL
jgi:hypothetical protein